jgi:NADPH:quinone reductase-like Zn-dependent oxidoreductase
VLDFGAQEFVDLENDVLEEVGEVELVFDVIGGDIGKRSAGLIRAGGALVSIVGRPRRGPPTAWRSTSLSSPIVPN